MIGTVRFGNAHLNTLQRDSVLLERQPPMDSPRRAYRVISDINTVPQQAGEMEQKIGPRVQGVFGYAEYVECPDGSFQQIRVRPPSGHSGRSLHTFWFNGDKDPVNEYYQVKKIAKADGRRIWLKG